MTGRDFPAARAVAHESSGRSAGGVRTALGAAVRGGVHSSHQTRAAPQRGVLSSGAGRCARQTPRTAATRPPLSFVDIKYVWSDCCLPSTGTGGQGPRDLPCGALSGGGRTFWWMKTHPGPSGSSSGAGNQPLPQPSASLLDCRQQRGDTVPCEGWTLGVHHRAAPHG